MTVVMSFCALCMLLVAGKVLRAMIPLLQRLYLPSSVIGGTLGLLIINFGKEYLDPRWFAGWSSLPGFLINVVFAALFLGATIPGIRRIWQIAAPQFCFGQILAWGQYVVGLGLVGLILGPLFGVPDIFGNLLEIGFEGGHGTVAGLHDLFNDLGWGIGADLGFTMATIGMVLGIVVGMILINVAVRKGYISHVRTFQSQSKLQRRGIYSPRQQPPAGNQTVYPDSVDSLAWHIALIGIAIVIGFAMKQLLASADTFAPAWLAETKILSSFPLFPLCMIGGLLLQKSAETLKLQSLINHAQMQRLSGAALDFLVLSAVASIRLEVVYAYWQPLLIMALFGTVWAVFMVMALAPHIFKEAWFERSIAEFGQSMGVTATGLLLLRTVDPESDTVAAKAFGYKQLLHEPIMGGGIWTSLALPLVFKYGWLPIWLLCTAVLIAWSCYAIFLIRSKQ